MCSVKFNVALISQKLCPIELCFCLVFLSRKKMISFLTQQKSLQLRLSEYKKNHFLCLAIILSIEDAVPLYRHSLHAGQCHLILPRAFNILQILLNKGFSKDAKCWWHSQAFVVLPVLINLAPYIVFLIISSSSLRSVHFTSTVL